MRIGIVPVSYVSSAGGGGTGLGALDADIDRLGMVCLPYMHMGLKMVNETFTMDTDPHGLAFLES